MPVEIFATIEPFWCLEVWKYGKYGNMVLTRDKAFPLFKSVVKSLNPKDSL